MIRWIAYALLACACLAAGGCRRFYQDEYDLAYSRLKDSLRERAGADERAQAVIICRSLLEADPDDTEVRLALAESLVAEPDLKRLFDKSMLGSNYTDRRVRKGFPVGGKIALYPLNRALDLIDLVTLEAGICFGIGAKVQATDFVALGAQASLYDASLGINRRHLSVRATADEFVEIGPVETRAFSEARAYTGGAYAAPYFHAGLKTPTREIYQRARDFWGVGAQAQVLPLAVFAQFHPVELWDFFAGWALLDPLRDDIGASQGIGLKPEERREMIRLARQVQARPRDAAPSRPAR